MKHIYVPSVIVAILSTIENAVMSYVVAEREVMETLLSLPFQLFLELQSKNNDRLMTRDTKLLKALFFKVSSSSLQDFQTSLQTTMEKMENNMPEGDYLFACTCFRETYKLLQIITSIQHYHDFHVSVVENEVILTIQT